MGCNQWGFAGDETVFVQSGDWLVIFKTNGTQAAGEASAIHTFDPGGPLGLDFLPHGDDVESMHGSVEGGIDGYHLKVTIAWDTGPVGVYEGSIDMNGIAKGMTYDATNPASTGTWQSRGPLKCLN